MSTPNPLVPQGSLLEQQARSKSTFQVAAFIVAIHVVILGGLLFLGCKKEEKLGEAPATDTLASPPAVTTDLSTNVPADPFAIPTNAVVAVPEPLLPPPVTQPVVEPVPSFSQPPTGGAVTEYTVQKNDAAYRIARTRNLTLKQLQEANPGIDLAKLKVGQKIQLPSAHSATADPFGIAPSPGTGASTEGFTTHTVKGGDNLSRLAKKHGTTVKAIREANGMTSNDIKVGQKLKIPSRTTAAKAAAPVPAAVEPPPVSTPSVIPTSPVVTPGQPVSP